MGIRSFKDKEVEVFFRTGKLPKKGWAKVYKSAMRKLDMLHYAKELKDLHSPPGNNLERLSGDLKGCYSIRINEQWRVVFGWKTQPYNVCILDYH